MFERFTDHARRVIVLAQEESRLLRHHEIGTEHLLLGLLNDAASDLAQAMAAFGVTSETARAELEKVRRRGRREPHGHIPFTTGAKRALEHSVLESERLGQDRISTAHLLLAILHVGDGAALQILATLGADLTALAATVDGIAAGSEPDNRRPGAVASHGIHGGGIGRIPRRLQYRLPDDREQLLQRLRRYCRHDDGCDPTCGCSCGLQALLDITGEGETPTD